MRSTTLPRVMFGALSLLALTSACTKKQEARQRPPVPVSATHARLADVPYTIDANGVVIPLRTSVVASQVEGIIQKVLFQEGQNVAQGQPLFQIDTRPYQAAYQQARAALTRDRASADNARRESERYAALAKQDYVTKEQADLQAANAASSAATLAADSAQMATAKFNLDNTTIRAPISGRTGGLLVREGNLVHANGGTPLVVINQISPILVRFAIPATQLPLLQRYGANGGLDVMATPNSGSDQAVDPAAAAIQLSIGKSDPGTAAGPNGAASGAGAPSGTGAPRSSPQLTSLVQPEKGSLSFIDNAVDTTTGTVLLKASFPNPNARLWVGEFVSAQLRLFVEEKALVVPSGAVVTGQQGAYVYIVTDSSTVQQRPVVVERTAGSQIIIASGLKAGDQIVTDGQSRLTPNAKVTVMVPGANGAGGGRGGRGGRGKRAGTDSSAAAAAPAAPGAAAPSAETPAAAAGAPKADSASGGRRGGRGGRGGRGRSGTAPSGE
ncbi:MAG: efflux transporter, family, subunit [Gemmatimonadetes bacterium]|nr:efflux transporter, family, subunit [Gemmatimonadota bacterium]